MENDMQELEKGLVALELYDIGLQADENASLRELGQSLGTTGPELVRLDTEYQTHLRSTKGRFNVFTVLRGSGEETGLHSAWLAYLLDPGEKHDCGPLFLNLFIKSLQKGVVRHSGIGPLDELTEFKDFNCATASVQKELCVKQGRIDILIRSPGSGIIAIENKIWAYEQFDQISRYGEYLKGQPEHKTKRVALLYLTLDGKPSATAKDCENQYRRISYRDHILPWLKDCLRETFQYVNINQALQQYTNLVYQIVYRCLPLEETFMAKIDDLIRKHPAIIRHWAELDSARHRLRIDCLKEFLLGYIPEALNAKSPGRFQVSVFRELEGKKNGNPAVAVTDKLNCALSNAPMAGKFVLAIEWYREQNRLIFGTILGREGVSDEKERLAKLRKLLLAGYRHGETNCNGWWLAGYWTLSEGFMADEWLSNCMNESKCREEARRVAEMVFDYLLLVEKWAKAEEA